MYESPIIVSFMEKVAKDIAEEFDNSVMKATMDANITVDKDELVKALAYDRGQYEKGYCDGYQAGKQDAVQILTELAGDSLKTKYAVDCVDEIPTVDAIEVVRCKDCALCSIGSNDAEQWCWCIHWSKDTDPTGYCFCGRRRDGADNDQN